MNGWLSFYADVLLGLGIVGSIVSLGLYVEARWIGLGSATWSDENHIPVERSPGRGLPGASWSLPAWGGARLNDEGRLRYRSRPRV